MKQIFTQTALIFCCGAAAVASPVLKGAEFLITNDVGPGNEVCVTGPHALLGGSDPLRAPKLVWTTGNVWRGTIALPAGEAISYRFIRRNFSTTSWGSPTNTVDLTGNLSTNVPAHSPVPWTNKTVLLHSPWTNANVYWRNLTAGQSNWTTTAMTAAGAGRNATEQLFRGAIGAGPGAEIEFVFNNGADSWSNAPAPPTNATAYQGLSGPFNFRTTLDQFFVQDGNVFNYRPPASVSPPTMITTNVGSTVANIPGRPVTIHLPRGYEQNIWKKYPVVYFHDGQNVFFPGGPFGTWDADRIANHEISQGRMREAILVAIPNGNAYGSNRLEEYLPDGDSIVYLGSPYSGKAASYAQWMLDNLAPTLDFNFRTFGDAANTLTAGSSMGGLVCDYLGLTRANRFGVVGIFSPAYWAADNYMSTRSPGAGTARAFVSMGTAESSAGESSSNVYWQDAVGAYSSFVRGGRVINRDVLFAGTAGGLHNEPAWSRLLPQFFAWALDPWREANPLALEMHPPELRLGARTDGTLDLQRTTLRGFAQTVATSSDLTAWTTNAVSNNGEAWDAVTDSVAPSERQFWRMRTFLP